MKLREAFAWALLTGVTSLGIANAIPANARTLPPTPTPTINLAIPASCLSTTATHRTYPLSIPAADTFARSGEHGHGKLTCIVFMTRSYSKILTIPNGGYVIGPNGIDVTYVDCSLPGYHFPPPPFTGANDCGESWGTTENDWRYKSGPATGMPMFPSTTP